MKDYSQFVFDTLSSLIPNPKSELVYSTPYELLVAVILSAQCTDKRVNAVTKELFKVANNPFDMDALPIDKLEEYIHSCGFYHNKAKNIKAMTKDIILKYCGNVPSSYEDLVALAGVGSKTANVVLACAFNLPGLAVDTHVFRVSKRLSLSSSNTALGAERDLKKLYPMDKWGEVHHLILLFGRYYCTSRSPKCDECKFKSFCKYYKERS